MNKDDKAPAIDGQRLDDLRQSLASGSSLDATVCPEPERFVMAVRGELAVADLQDLVSHTAECSACAVAWRIARQAREQELSKGRWSILRGRWRPLIAAAALAASLLLAIGLFWQPATIPPGVERNLEQKELESLVVGETLPRHDFLLRWRGPEENLMYQLTISSEDLTLIDQVQDWPKTEYQVAVDRLAELPSGVNILWKVETTLESGQSIYKTFVNSMSD